MKRTARSVVLTAVTIANIGCVPLPIALPVSDRPPGMGAFPSDFGSGNGETLVLASSSRGVGVTLDEPMFIAFRDTAAVDEKLGRTSWYGSVIILPFGPPIPFSVKNEVKELCFVDTSGRTLALLRSGEAWDHSEVSLMSAGWREQFVRYLLDDAPGTLAPIWRSGPCARIEWGGVNMTWDAEHRNRVAAFLAKLPLPQ